MCEALKPTVMRHTGVEKSAEAIVADLGGEGRNQSTVTGDGIAWVERGRKETLKVR